MNNRTAVSLSLDLDWAIDEILEDTLELLSQFNRPATLFCTNDSPVLRTITHSQQFELGIHPNFNFLLLNQGNRSSQQIIEEMMAIFPDAIGLRSHSLTQSSSILNEAHSLGIKYDSNLYHPSQAEPYKDFSGLHV